MKTKQLFLFLMLLCTGMSWGQYTVNFEGTNETKTSYASGNVNLSGIEWNLTEALIGTHTADYKNGSRSARMRGYGTSLMTMNADKTSGAGTVSFSYRRYGTDSQVDWKVEYSHNNGIWTQLGSTFTSPPDNDIQTFSETLNLSGNIKIRILRGTSSGTINSRLNIDDIIITDYSIPPSNSPPTASNVTFTGTLNPNETLTSSYTYIDADDDLQGTSTFKWYRADNASGSNETAISGATLSTYTLQNDDLSKFISFGVVPIAATGSNPGVEVKSAYQGPITDAAATTISVSQSLTTFTNTCINQSSASQSYTVSASNLTANLTITAPTHFEISTDESSWSNSLNIVPVSGVVDATTIYVRFSPTAVGVQTGSINHTSTGASTQSIALNGTSINTTPTITSPTSASITANSAVLGGNITDLGCNSVTTRGVEYSTTIDFSNGTGTIVSEIGTFSTGTFSMNISGLSTGTTYYFKAFATSSSGTVYTTQATFTTVAIAAPVATAATNEGSTSFTAQWNAVAGATSYEIDVYESSVIMATDLFISEYGEGTPGNRKFVEIFNGTGNNVDLSLYKLIRATNGGGFPTSGTAVVTLTGTLSNGVTLTIANNSTDVPGADIYNSSFASWNGDDAIGLFKNNVLIDVFGTPDSDPGTGWAVAGTNDATVDNILVRKSNIITGNLDWAASAGTTVENSEWIISRVWNAIDPSTPTTLGNHTFNSVNNTYHIQNQDVGNVTTFQVTGLNQNTQYKYVVRAKDATSVSINSNEISVTTTIANTTWNGTSWSNGAPDNTVDAIIDGALSTSVDVICKDLTVNTGHTLTINAADKLSVNGNLINNGSIVFKSNNTSTGRFDTYTGAPITGSGSVTMERFIDGKRAFRLLAPGVNTSGTIANNWQQQIFITGSTTGANGFDATATGAASMFTFGDNGWASIANTDVLQLNADQGYRVLIRGDRTPSLLTSPSNGNMNNPVTLSATGTMVTGDVVYNTLSNQEYTLIANPYISPINWATITKNGVTDTYYAWDPNLGTGVQRGRFVSCDVAGITSVLSDTGSPNTDIDQHIQPGQAVFIRKATIGTPGSITVKETDKASTFTDVFRTSEQYNNQNTILGKLGINLYESLAYSLGDYPIDGAVALSGITFNTESTTDDTKKIMSHGEQVTFVRENIQLGIEKISTPVVDDVLTIGSVNLVPNKSYVWRMKLQDDFSNLDAYLYDAFTQNYHLLTNSNSTVIPFETTNDTNSTFVNRFKIVFQETMHVDDFSLNVALYPNPGKSNQSFYLHGVTDAKVSMDSLLGQEISVTTHQNGQTMEVKPMTALSAGVYFVRIIQEGKSAQVKWIVE